MQTIDRNLIYIVPKQACIDWVNNIFPDDPVYNKEMKGHDYASVFLIPEFDTPEKAMQWMEKSWETWFDSLLLEWCADEDLWPQNRSWNLLNEYFDIRYHSLIFDALPLQIKKEEI